MAKGKSFSILLIALMVVVAEASGTHQLSYFPMICGEDCLAGYGSDEEFSMESESTRRMLAYRRRYISYGALSRNRVPCSRRGASYYNCRPGAQANPYQRGCSAITRCRG
ncbi:unnamed protein product [Withania somnifera]